MVPPSLSLASRRRWRYYLLFIFLTILATVGHAQSANVTVRNATPMPTYEYQCQTCGYAFEEFQSITAEPLTACPKDDCGGTVKRLISAGAGLLFKGSGFYITDYRSDGYKESAKADAANGSGGSAKEGGSNPGSSDSGGGTSEKSTSSSESGSSE